MNASATPALLEIAADSLGSALAAQQGGAGRVELCGGLAEGGLTPSQGVAAVARERLRIPLHVLVRPRSGDFVYGKAEIEAMCRDIEAFARIGCDGVVTGVLDADGRIDVEAMAVLRDAAGPMTLTFHRAFDLTRDPLQALDAAIELGCARVLTSGMRERAIDGAARIAELVGRAGKRLQVMPGGGIDEYCIGRLRSRTGAREFHASLRSPLAPPPRSPRLAPLFGRPMQTDVARVRRVVALLAES